MEFGDFLNLTAQDYTGKYVIPGEKTKPLVLEHLVVPPGIVQEQIKEFDSSSEKYPVSALYMYSEENTPLGSVKDIVLEPSIVDVILDQSKFELVGERLYVISRIPNQHVMFMELSPDGESIHCIILYLKHPETEEIVDFPMPLYPDQFLPFDDDWRNFEFPQVF